MEKNRLQQKSEEVVSNSEGDIPVEKIPNVEKLPKSRFELIDPAKEAELCYSFMKTDRFSPMFDKAYPQLLAIQNECKDKDECVKRYRGFFENLQIERREKMVEAKEQIAFEWGKINAAFLKELSDHFETKWPDDRAEIIGYVSNLPVFPRFLDAYQFCVGYKNVADSIETSAHEILHFLWFKKWGEVFPDINRREYEAPHLAWRLSEIMDPIILQCNHKIKELINPKRWGYTSFGEIKIGDVGMIDFFKKIYLNGLASSDSFEIILKKLWDETNKHEKEISVF